MWQNDALQQVAQATIFVTLLSGIIERARQAPDPNPIDRAFADAALMQILVFLTLAASAFGMVVSFLEVLGQPEEKYRAAKRKYRKAKQLIALWNRSIREVGLLRFLKRHLTWGVFRRCLGLVLVSAEGGGEDALNVAGEDALNTLENATASHKDYNPSRASRRESRRSLGAHTSMRPTSERV
jgi:hypothetical protein